MSDARERLEELTIQHFEGTLDSEGEKELARRLSESPEACRFFASYMRLEGAAIQLAQAECLSASGSTPTDEPRPELRTPTGRARQGAGGRFSRLRRTGWTAAAGILFALGLWSLHLHLFDRDEVPTADLVTVGRVVSARWGDAGAPLVPGDVLGTGTIQLESGLVQLEFSSGATVVLEGPAEFEVVSAMRGYCDHGKLRTYVPPGAHGFTIETPDVTVVDLGTEFGLQLDEAGNVEVHVYNGAVEIHEATFDIAVEDKQLLRAGRAVKLGKSGRKDEIPVNDDGFVSAGRLASLSELYVRDLQQQFARLQDRQQTIDRELKTSIQKVAQSNELLMLKKLADEAAKTLADYLRSNPEIARTEGALQEATAQVEKLVRQKTGADREGAAILEAQKEIVARLAELRNRKKEIRGPQAGRRMRSIQREISQLASQQREHARRLKAIRTRVERRDPDLIRARANLAADRRAAEQSEHGQRLRELRREARKTQQAYQQRRKELLGTDDAVRSLRAARTILSLETRDMRARIRRLRQSEAGHKSPRAPGARRGTRPSPSRPPRGAP